MSYPQPGRAPARNEAIDSLRGLLLVAMALNHIPTSLRILTDQPLGYVSSAEGFFFVSGLLAGRVYTLRARAEGGVTPLRSGVRRALELYRAHALTVIAVFALSWAHPLLGQPIPDGVPHPFVEQPIAALAAALALLFQPGLLDILPIYVAMMLLLPLVLWLCERSRSGLVLALSLAVWALTTVFDGSEPYHRGLILTGAFNTGAWQLLFVVGACVGHGWAIGKAIVPRIPRPLLGFLVLAAASLCAWRHDLLPLAALDARGFVASKINLGPLRLVNSLLLFYLVHLALQRWRDVLSWAPLALIGRHGLLTFSVHVIVAQLIISLPALFPESGRGALAGPFLLLASMSAAAWIAEQRKLRPSSALEWTTPERAPLPDVERELEGGQAISGVEAPSNASTL